jgi:hypothetical protein
MLQVLNLYGNSQRNRHASEHVCCHLDKLELSYSCWVMGGLTWSLFTDRQRGAKKPTLQVPYNLGVVSFQFVSFVLYSCFVSFFLLFLHFLFLASRSTFLHTTFLPFPSLALSTYLLFNLFFLSVSFLRSLIFRPFFHSFCRPPFTATL